jgi:hypothetical protein
MRDPLNGSPHNNEEETSRSPLSAEAPELSSQSHSSDEVYKKKERIIDCILFYVL